MLPICLPEWQEWKWPQSRGRGMQWTEYFRWGQWLRWKEGKRGPCHWCTPYSSQRAPHRLRTSWNGLWKQSTLRGWGGHLHHHQPNSWPRWLQRLGHLSWVGRSQSGGSSDLLWEAKPPSRNSSRMVKSRRPGSSGLAQLPFVRSGSFKRAQSSSSGNPPSCS